MTGLGQPLEVDLRRRAPLAARAVHVSNGQLVHAVVVVEQYAAEGVA